MKKGNAIFEHILMVISVFFAGGLFINDDLDHGIAAAFVWLIFLSIAQLVHSCVIADAYWKNKKIRAAVLIYWIVAGVHLFGPIYYEITFFNKESTDWFIIPFGLSAWLWFISWYFGEKKGIEKKNTRSEM